MVKVLFLDLSTRTGFAHDDPANPGAPVFGTIRLEPQGNDYGRLYSIFANRHLTPLITKVKPQLIGFEAPLTIQASRFSRTSTHVARLLFGLAAVTDLTITDLGIEAVETNIQDLKKYLTGDRFAKKDAMIARARSLGWMVQDDNQADACAGWAFCKAIRDKKFTPTTIEIAAKPPTAPAKPATPPPGGMPV